MSAEREIISQLQKLNDQLGQMARATGARIDGRGAVPGEVESMRGRGGRYGGGRNRAQDGLLKSSESADTASREWTKTAKDLKRVSESWGKLNDALNSSTGYLTGLDADIMTFGRNIFSVKRHIDTLVAGMGRYSHVMSKTAKAQSMLYAHQTRAIAQLDEFLQAAAYEKIIASFENLDQATKKTIGILDEATGNLRTDLSFEDLAEKRAALGEMLSTVTEQLEESKIGSLKDILNDLSALTDGVDLPGKADIGTEKKAAIVKIAAALEKGGLIQPSESMSVFNTIRDAETGNIISQSMKDEAQLEKLFSGNSQTEFIKMLDDKVSGLTTAVKKADEAVDNLQTPFGKLQTALTTISGRLGLLDKALSYFLTTAALYKAADGFKVLYKELASFNAAQIPASYLSVVGASWRLGMSFEKTTELLNENKRMMAILGPDQFKKSLYGMRDTFLEFGYSMEQAADLVAPGVESAIVAGVNVRDSAAVGTFIKSLMEGAKSISGVIAMNAKEYAKLNLELVNAEDTFHNLMGMDTLRRQAYVKDLEMMRNKYIVDGMSVQQAQEMVALQEKQRRDKVATRAMDAAKIAMMGSQLGMSPEEIQKLYRGTISRAQKSPQEKQEYDALLKRIAVGSLQMQEAADRTDDATSFSVQGLRDSLNPEGALASMLSGMLVPVSKEQAGANLKGNEPAEAAKMAQGSAIGAAFIDWINTLSTIMNSALTAAALGATAGLGWVAFQALKTGKILGMISGGGLSGLPSKLGKFGTLGGWAAGATGTAATAATTAGGVAGAAAGTAATTAGTTAATTAGTAATAAGGAAAASKLGLLAKGLGVAGAGALGAYAAGEAGSSLIEAGHAKTGALVSILGSAGSGALAGSMFGVPGAIIGGGAGAVYGAYKTLTAKPAMAASSPASPVISGTSKPIIPGIESPPPLNRVSIPESEAAGPKSSSINTQQLNSDKTIAVKDVAAVDQLMLLTNLASQMVELLQKMSEKDGLAQALNSTNRTPRVGVSSVPPAHAYLSGTNAR
jgi:hypothetical protein